MRQTAWEHFGSGQPAVHHIAGALGKNSRTLQRGSCDERVSFSQVFDDQRQAMAERLLREYRRSMIRSKT